MQPGHPPLLGPDGVLGGPAVADRGLQDLPVPVQLDRERLLLGTHPDRLRLQLLGLASDGLLRLGGSAGGVPDPLGSQGGGAPQPLTQTGQREPGLLGRRQRGQVRAQGGLQAGLVLLAPGDLVLGLPAAPEQLRLVGELVGERGPGGDQVVGQDPGPGVADVGLHGRGPPGDLGLTAQRLELATDLGDQVGEAGEVAVGGVQLAQRLLLALAVLEDSGCLLDEPATVLGGGVQDGVELPLTDDDVHLATDAGVREQLLDVEQACGTPLMAYSDPPLRNIVRLIVTSA